MKPSARSVPKALFVHLADVKRWRAVLPCWRDSYCDFFFMGKHGPLCSQVALATSDSQRFP